MGSDSDEVQQQVGCGSGSGIDLSQITLNINTTTGGSFSVNVDNQISVENLKKIVAKKLKVAKDRICLLHREKVLNDGTSVKENGILDGSRIILLPNVETGLLAQRPENTVMQALESLNDSQVNDFLSGKTPLNLSMRLGDHMMLIQLQLSTVNPTGSSSSASTSGTSLGASTSRDVAKHLKHMKSLSNLNLFGNRSKTHSINRPSSSSHQMSAPIKFSNVTSGECSTSAHSDPLPSKNNLEDLSQIVNALEKVKQRQEIASNRLISEHSMDTSDIEQSPIKSLSNLVSSPLNASSLKSIHLKSTSTSCSCKSTQNTDSGGMGCNLNCQYSHTYSQVAHKRMHLHQSESKSLTRSSAFLHKTINNPISKARSFNYSSAASQQIGESSTSTAYIRRSNSSESISTNQEQGIAKMLATKLANKELATDQALSIIDATAGSSIDDVATGTGTTETLAEASRNLTKTLRKLSKEVFSTKGESSVSALHEEKRSRTSSTSNVPSTSGSQQNGSVSGLGSGAVIESMRNHGRGIYSGTFSGTLNPALQDRFGRPKRDISTVIHILNDLLSATPQYSRGARISFEPAHNSRSSKYASSSKRTSGSGSSMSQPSHSRSQCTKCSPLSKKTGECGADCIRAHRSSSNRSASTIVTNDLKQRITSKSTSLPATPHSKIPSIDCRQCQMPLLSNSAPVTPTKESTDQIAHLNKSNISSVSNTSLDSSNVSSNFDFRNSSNDLSMCSPLLANVMNQSSISSNSPICTKCSNMEMENNKTKTKLDQLRLVMQQRREQREARKLRSAPYGGRIIGAAATATTSNSTSNPTNQNDSANNGTVIQATVDGLPSNPIVEQVNTLA